MTPSTSNPLALQDAVNRRTFLKTTAHGIGAAALASMLPSGGQAGLPGYVPKAKRVIYLFQSGAPSQMDLFDPKPGLAGKRHEDLPDSIRQGQRITTMTSGQKTLPVAPSIFGFQKHGQSGAELSELLPHMAQILCQAL